MAITLSPLLTISYPVEPIPKMLMSFGFLLEDWAASTTAAAAVDIVPEAAMGFELLNTKF
uniref:Uncharacterized protein n=1 Tax=Rhizophora mucronata TaxID=61149 RepID=A0A2P2P0Q8_RHIMU